VVLWSTFDQLVVEDPKTLWVHGSRLVSSLAERRPRLSAAEIAEVAAVLRRHA
jgi:hypothetical protein